MFRMLPFYDYDNGYGLRCGLDEAVLVLEERGTPTISSGPGRSGAMSASGGGAGSGSSTINGPAMALYERLVRAVLGRDKDASAQPQAQETLESLVRVLRGQAHNLKVSGSD